jgi:RHS repeat-associated protein
MLVPGCVALKSQTTQWDSRHLSGRTASGPPVYLYDGYNLGEEIDGSGTLVARYTGEDEIDEPLAEFRSGTTSYDEQDGQGSISSLSNSAGTLVNTYTYDSFGRLASSTGSVLNPLQYTAREFDSETQLYFNRTRYRDPVTGQWLNEDPARFSAGINFYSYVLNNPLAYRDPLGRQSQMPSCYPDCVHTQEEIQRMEREHETVTEQIFPPPPPGRPDASESQCACRQIERVREQTRNKELDKVIEWVGLDSGFRLAEIFGGRLAEKFIPYVGEADTLYLGYELLKIDDEGEAAERQYYEKCYGWDPLKF